MNEALPLLEQVCHSDPRDVEAWFLLGGTRQELRDFSAAAEAYRRAIALDPQHAESHYYLGNTCLALGDGPGAVTAFRETLRLQPQHRRARLNLAALYELQKNFPDAEECTREALRHEPQNAELHCSLGNILHAQKKYNDAVDSYRRALDLRPDHADTYNNCGISLALLERYDESLACYRQAFQLNPRLVAALNNMGNTLLQMQRTNEAMKVYEQALQIDPCYAEVLTGMGNVLLRRLGRIEEAIRYHHRAIECQPAYADAHYNLAHCLLLQGEFKEGWREYDWRWKREGGMRRPLPPTPRDGVDLNGRQIFIHAEQGIGDELFFLRFLPLLKKRGADQVVYRASAKIASLAARATGIDRLAAPDEQPAPTDMVCAVGDLPLLLGPAPPDQTPAAVALTPLPEPLARVRRELTGCGAPPYLGVTWRAGVKGNELVLYKETPVERLALLLRDVPGTILILQRFPQEDELRAFQEAAGRPVHNFSNLNDDLEGMHALLALIDEYVGVSNTNMHLRAAVGKTARVLVPAPPEWRWMAKGKESPWFPGFSVYRQGYDGDWTQTFSQLESDLRDACEHWRH